MTVYVLPATAVNRSDVWLPATMTESNFNELLGSFGSVPARYSCKLVKPSPSGSAFGVASELSIAPKYWISHASGNPSPSVSPGVLTALGAPAVGDAAIQLAGSSPKSVPTLRCKELPVPAAPAGQGDNAE